MNKKDDKLVSEILTHYIAENRESYSIYDEVGRTLENFIKQQKSDEAVKAIEYTVMYLKKKKTRGQNNHA